MDGLLIDRLRDVAERHPDGTLLGGLGNAEAWAQSGAVASWLIAQGYGPGGKSLSLRAPDAVLQLGALRAGALLAIGEHDDALPIGALKSCSVDASVAERRLHITAATPAQVRDGRRLTHGDLATL
jgi:hypothetical protein